MALPLEGLKVLDCSRLLPGPYATLVLADLGAQVDKVEDPQGGDYTRHMPPLKDDVSALFLGLNRNKRSVTLDFKQPAGVEAFKRLVQGYDVLVESFRPGVMDKLGLGYEALHALNPKLVYCSISGYGHTGPDRLKAGHDLDYIGRSGVLGYGGQRGGAPAMPGVQIGDIGGGSLFALVGIFTALYERQRTGQGRFVDVSMTDGSMAFLHMHLAARLLLGKEAGPLTRGAEALNGGYPCYGTYETKDGKYLAVGALEPKFFDGLLQALGKPELMMGAWDTGEEGAKTRKALQETFKSQPLTHWLELFSRHDVCVEPVREGDEVLEDPQLKARGLFVEKDGVTHLRTPLNFGPPRLEAPPALGEHTRAVLEEAGLAAAEIEAVARG